MYSKYLGTQLKSFNRSKKIEPHPFQNIDYATADDYLHDLTQVVGFLL